MHKDTITLFNRKPGARGQGNTWYPTVIEGCNLNIDRAAILAKYGPQSSDNAALHVPYKRAAGAVLVEDALTFTSGNDFDFFWKGVWDGGIVSDSDYGDEGFYNYMNRERDYVFAITSVAQYSVIPHFEIMGK